MAMDDAEFALLLRDLQDEADELVRTLAGIDDDAWMDATPAAGWTIHDQVVHLAYFDDLVGLGFRDPTAFVARAAEVQSTGDDWVDRLSHDRSAMPAAETLEWFARSRRSAVAMFAQLGPSARSPWFGPSMSAASSATARLMETWAHGQDIYDTLGIDRELSERIRHVAHLGVITRAFSYRVRGMDAPPTEVRVELVSPSGGLWTWGADDLVDKVSGSAGDFALVVTQRRNIADTALLATPGAAAEWMTLAQAFAGAASPGRPAGEFAKREATA